MRNKNNKKVTDNAYGGVRYRFSYDDFRRAAGIRQMRLKKRGARSFGIAVGMVSVFCVCTLAVSLVYKSAETKYRTDVANRGESAEGDAVAVNSHVVSEAETYTYPKYFAVSEMDERAKDIYHLPDGVIISKVYHSEGGINGDTVAYGDIIVAVDGERTPDGVSFDSAFSSAKGRVNFTVYRKEKNLNFEYVIDYDE